MVRCTKDDSLVALALRCVWILLKNNGAQSYCFWVEQKLVHSKNRALKSGAISYVLQEKNAYSALKKGNCLSVK